MKEPCYIDRPPRIQPELPAGEVPLPKLVEQRRQTAGRLVQIALPLVSIMGYVLVTALASQPGAGGGRRLMLIPMALSVLASMAFSFASYRRERREQAEQDNAYANRLTELHKELQIKHDLQRRFYDYNYPGFEAIRAILRAARPSDPPLLGELRSVARLWERRWEDPDFGVVRLGVGSIPSTFRYTFEGGDDLQHKHRRAALKLAAASHVLRDAPVLLALAQREQGAEPDDEEALAHLSQVPRAHALGIAGDRQAVYPFVRALVTQFTAFHSPGDARLYVLAASSGDWAWSRELPHASGDAQAPQLCFADELGDAEPDPLAAEDEGGPLEQYLEGLRKQLAQRRIRLQEREESSVGDPTSPFLLLIVDLLAAGESPLRQIETNPALAILLAEGAALGASVIFLVPNRSKVPSGCRAMIEVERTTPPANLSQGSSALHFRYIETGVNSARFVGVAEAVAQHTPDPLQQYAQELAALRVREGAGATLASAVPFLGLVGHRSLAELVEGARRSWGRSAQAETANWLRVKLGLMAGNKPRTLVFSAKRDGVHGMVAGSTGSGKSELLISLIAGMAVTYDPTVLNFVLVDYKGGGAFKEFSDLPHCVDVITNLAGDGVTRMFTAINAEMKRRQALNAETGTKNIVDYRKKGLHLSHAPYPFLFIIIDEFAEMIADRPEYRHELESITRVGRAQGVSLILAAQRPSGVTDQMRSNIKFRICLRVETSAESREMLRRGDAAFLPPGLPGRGYLQVGNDEIEQIQVAYSGEPYADPRRAAPAVIWPDRAGTGDAQEEAAPALYQAIIGALKELALAEERPMQRAPWPNVLPGELFLTQTLLSDDPAVPAVTSREYLADLDALTLGRPAPPSLALSPALSSWLNGGCGWAEELDWGMYALRPVVGLVDNPYGARQHPLVVDLPRGHVALFGASGSGKTVMLRTLLLSLMATHSPDQLHCYILDLGGRNFGALRGLPHVGAVVLPDEEGYKERVEQILREFADQIELRKARLNEARAASVYEYNQARPDRPLPAIVFAIDNMVEFIETFGDGEANVETVLERFIGLARQARTYGIHFVVTTGKLNDLSSQLFSLFTERFALRLTDPTDYRTIVGGNVGGGSDIPGRGYVRVGSRPLSFQAARSISPRAGRSELDEIEQWVQLVDAHLLQAGRSYARPTPVNALPKAVLLRDLLARQDDALVGPDLLDRLEQQTAAWWAASYEGAQLDWLRVLIGVTSGDRPRTLALEAKLDGVHGMIAGGTGSGKSELLMTMIVSMALRYDPRMLNFVLVDYKGGGAFAPFEGLPHVVESVTNLNKSAVRRMFTAIGAEMKRRQALNVATQTENIVHYHREGYHRTREPYPFLFIIIDEYAEMIADSPEFGAELDSITRVGRAQGVFLLLAAQRPVGVSDQMRANIKLRICLRVEQAETSRELLRRSDAASLPSGMPGRGYIQAGGESIELVQVAYCGEKVKEAAPKENGEQPRFFELAVALARRVFADARPRTPWPPPLPAALTLGDSLDAADFPDEAVRGMTFGQDRQLMLNPFAQDWLEGTGAWPRVDWRHLAMRAVVGLADDPANARRLPLVVDLTRGHCVAFGAAGWGKTTLLRTLALSLAASHSPAELHIHALDLGSRGLEHLQRLPHVGTVIVPDERGYEERVQQLWRELGALLDRRKAECSMAGVNTLGEYNHARPGQRLPAVLVLIDNIGELIETFGADSRSADDGNLLEAFVALARQGKAYGLHFAITAARLNILSSKIYSLFTERLTLRLAGNDDYGAIVGVRVDEVDEIPGRGYVRVGRSALAFQVAVAPGAVDAEGAPSGEIERLRAIGAGMQQRLGQLDRAPSPLRIGALPKSVLYRDLLRRDAGLQPGAEPGAFLASLKAWMRAEWQRNATAQHAEWLRVDLGTVSGERTRKLRLEAKEDGVHGMVAGGTGSGKSELLMALIVGLALRYPPEILNFVLVDYKGGGAFTPFRQLPHCVDIVTNLNPAAVARMFTSIAAEIERRQELNTRTRTKDIVEYRKAGYHLTVEPYPHLFIIIDEYAEMIDANDAFRQQLDSITRVGRAQGVNLLLASQQPKGVSDQMRANIKLRLCLRVEQKETSRELLQRPDAALLPNGMPGRGYLQIGNDTIELIQVAYTGDPQLDDRRPVAWPGRPPREAQSGDADPPPFFGMVVQLAAELTGGAMAPRPWPAFLPERLTLEAPIRDSQRRTTFYLLPAVSDWLNGETGDLWPPLDEQSALQPVVGLVDRPLQARQEPLRLDLQRSHLAVFGDPGMGKTSLLRTILVSLAATHSPDDLHMYVLDMGGQSFRSLEALPHLGAVIYADEDLFEERLVRLLERLAAEVLSRQQLLGEAGASSLAEYNRARPETGLPYLLVVIDNIVELRQSYEALLEERLLPLVRRGMAVGLRFVVSANEPSSMTGRLYNLFTERLTFKQANHDRYIDIVGRGALEIGDLPGRGYIRRDGRALMLQAAIPVGLWDGDGRPLGREADELQTLARHIGLELARRVRRTPPADPIATLANVVDLEQLLAEAGPPSERRIEAVPGRTEDLRPARIDLRRRGPHLLLVGPPMAGKTTALYAWVLSLAWRYSPARVGFIFVDTQGRFVTYGGKRSLDNLPHRLEVVTDKEQLQALVGRLREECAVLAAGPGDRAIFVVIDNYDDLSEDLAGTRGLDNELATLARRHGRDGLHVLAAVSPESGGADMLRRRVAAANFGLGLRTAAAVEALRVQRTPAGVRGRELPAGRGYLVKAGQAVQIQLAAPFAAGSPLRSGDDDDEEVRRAQGLDAWVDRICARYPDEQAVWFGATEGDPGVEADEAGPPPRDPRVSEMLAAVEAALDLLGSAGDEAGAQLALRLQSLDKEQRQSSAALRGLLREAVLLLCAQRGQGSTGQLMVSSLPDDTALLVAAQGELQLSAARRLTLLLDQSLPLLPRGAEAGTADGEGLAARYRGLTAEQRQSPALLSPLARELYVALLAAARGDGAVASPPAEDMDEPALVAAVGSLGLALRLRRLGEQLRKELESGDGIPAGDAAARLEELTPEQRAEPAELLPLVRALGAHALDRRGASPEEQAALAALDDPEQFIAQLNRELRRSRSALLITSIDRLVQRLGSVWTTPDARGESFDSAFAQIRLRPDPHPSSFTSLLKALYRQLGEVQGVPEESTAVRLQEARGGGPEALIALVEERITL